MDNQDNNNFNNRDRRPFNNNRGNNYNRNDNNRRFNNNQNHERRFEDMDLSGKTDEQIIQILVDKQKKIGRNIFGSDIRPLYELIIRQNKKIKALEDKLASKSE